MIDYKNTTENDDKSETNLEIFEKVLMIITVFGLITECLVRIMERL